VAEDLHEEEAVVVDLHEEEAVVVDLHEEEVVAEDLHEEVLHEAVEEKQLCVLLNDDLLMLDTVSMINRNVLKLIHHQ